MDIAAFELQQYIDDAQEAIWFFLDCRQWDGLKKSEVLRWLENFGEDINDQYFPMRLLRHFFYYSKEDMKLLLKDAVFHRILETKVFLEKQVPSNFSLNQEMLKNELDSMIRKTLFVPLLDSGRPSESGNEITRILLQQLGVPSSQIVFTDRINPKCLGIERLIIVDDCVGTGDQCRGFWPNSTILDGTSLRHWCDANKIEPYYVMLVGYNSSLEDLKKEFPDLNILCAETLQDEHRVFNQQSIFWRNEEEMLKAREFFQTVTNRVNLPFWGYRELDFAVILHQTIPDWSLPMFWKYSEGWSILMKRKDSYV